MLKNCEMKTGIRDKEEEEEISFALIETSDDENGTCKREIEKRLPFSNSFSRVFGHQNTMKDEG